MKKLIFLACLLLSYFALMLTACGENPSVQPSETETATPSDSLPENPSTETTEEVHVHTFGQWFIKQYASCTLGGQQERTCICGEKETQSTDPVGHLWSKDYESDKNSHWQCCTRCGKSGEATAHTIGADWYCTVCEVMPNETAGIVFKISSDRTYAEVTGYTGTEAKVYIPKKYNDLPVTVIRDGAFMLCQILTEVTIPDSVTTIESEAFSSCENLTRVTLGKSVTVIYSEAFRRCESLTSINIPDGLTYIGSKAFEDCESLTNIRIPDSIKRIHTYAFGDCDNLQFTKDGDAKYLGNSDNPYVALIRGSGDGRIHKDTKIIAAGAFEECHSLTSITIPNGIAWIDVATFRNCSNLTSVVIPESVTTIAGAAFEGCTSLAEITIPNSVTHLVSGTFSGCSSLIRITLPTSITEISYDVFEECDLLKEIRFDGTKSQWQAIKKDSDWDSGIQNYTIYCVDGTITT